MPEQDASGHKRDAEEVEGCVCCKRAKRGQGNALKRGASAAAAGGDVCYQSTARELAPFAKLACHMCSARQHLWRGRVWWGGGSAVWCGASMAVRCGMRVESLRGAAWGDVVWRSAAYSIVISSTRSWACRNSRHLRSKRQKWAVVSHACLYWSGTSTEKLRCHNTYRNVRMTVLQTAGYTQLINVYVSPQNCGFVILPQHATILLRHGTASSPSADVHMKRQVLP